MNADARGSTSASPERMRRDDGRDGPPLGRGGGHVSLVSRRESGEKGTRQAD
jgi:hypothetical protein